MLADVAVLQAKLADANARIAALEAALAQSDWLLGTAEWSPLETRLLRALMSMPVVDRAKVLSMRLVPLGPGCADQIVWRLRHKLEARGINVRSVRHVGWMLTDGDKQKLFAAQQGE